MEYKLLEEQDLQLMKEVIEDDEIVYVHDYEDGENN